jgi:hypothetical protein
LPDLPATLKSDTKNDETPPCKGTICLASDPKIKTNKASTDYPVVEKGVKVKRSDCPFLPLERTMSAALTPLPIYVLK